MRPIRAVIFDFHATLVDQGDAAEWLDLAIDTLGAADEIDREAVSRRLDALWIHAREIDPDSERDLSAERHRETFIGVMSGHVPDDLLVVLYDVMLELWVAYEEAAHVLSELRSRGIRTAILSNVGFDIRPLLTREGLEPDVMVLSYEVGVVKPNPGIFAAAIEALGVPPEDVLMVGDSWMDDAAAAALGIRTLILPRTRGRHHGLDIVLRLTD